MNTKTDKPRTSPNKQEGNSGVYLHETQQSNMAWGLTLYFSSSLQDNHKVLN